MSRLRLGISACLLGQRVRYDARIKRYPQILDQLSDLVALLPVCPEFECGLDVPREAIQLEDDLKNPVLRTVHSHRNISTQMTDWSAQRLDLLAASRLDGYLFKSKSPSCGLIDTPVFAADGQVLGYDAGLYARALQNRFADLPVCDEKALEDPRRWNIFVEQILQNWRARGGDLAQQDFAGQGARDPSPDTLRQSLKALARTAD